MKSSLLLSLGALLLAACGSVASDEAPESAPAAPAADRVLMPTMEELDDLAMADPRGVSEAAGWMLGRLESRPEEERRASAEALASLTVTCPYNRSAVQLTLALHQVASRHEAEALPMHVQRDWEHLRRGLDTHVAILDALEAELPLPVEGDFLAGRIPEELLLTRAELEAVADPLTPTIGLVGEIRPVVEQYDPPTQTSIEFQDRQLLWTLGAHWPMYTHYRTWRDTLRKLVPQLEEEGPLRDDLRAMSEALDALGNETC